MRVSAKSWAFRIIAPGLLIAFAMLIPGAGLAEHKHVTQVFAGVKVNGGTVSHRKDGKANVFTLSEDFKVPDAPAPHWQVVDSKGNTYLLHRLKIKGDKLNKSIKLPSYTARGQ